MAGRSSVDHDGFLIPNAADAPYPRMSEPDAIDFSTIANARWGVVDGCSVSVSGTSGTVNPGTVVIDGILKPIVGGTVHFGNGGSQDRFDLVVADTAGNVKVLPGNPQVDPVFPEVPDDCVLLASVFCPTTGDSFANNVVDKRRFVSKALLTKIAATDALIRNVNGSGDYFNVAGDGRTGWAGDTYLYRSKEHTLKIEDDLELSGSVYPGKDVHAGRDIIADRYVTGLNLGVGDTLPTYTSYPLGALYQRLSTGKLYIRSDTGWEELMTAAGAIPVGTVIQSLEIPANMPGWVPLNGQTDVSEDIYPRLFGIAALAGNINSGSVAPHRTMTMPNAQGRMLMGGTNFIGQPGGNQSNNRITLSPAQLPPHKHNVQTIVDGGSTPSAHIGRAGGHKHTVSGGEHSHPVTDPGHGHYHGQYPAGAFVCLVWGGQNKIDALFNDRNHTYSVSAVDWVANAQTGISIGSEGSGHGHNMSDDGDHEHQIFFDNVPVHNHVVTEDPVGQGAAIDITPAYLTVYTYIRS